MRIRILIVNNDRIVPRDDGPSLNDWDDGRFSGAIVSLLQFCQ